MAGVGEEESTLTSSTAHETWPHPSQWNDGKDIIRRNLRVGKVHVRDLRMVGIVPNTTPEDIDFSANISNISPRLFISDVQILNQPLMLKKYDISTIINMSTSWADAPTRTRFKEAKVAYKEFTLTEYERPKVFQDDFANVRDKFERCHEAILKAVSASMTGNVVVHCFAGINRSCSAVAYHIMQTQQCCHEKAIALVKSKRSIADPSDEYLWVLAKCCPVCNPLIGRSLVTAGAVAGSGPGSVAAVEIVERVMWIPKREINLEKE